MVETSQGRSRPAHSIERPAGTGWAGWGPASGIAFVVFFVGTSFMSGTPDTNASNSAWTAWFASASHRDLLLATGFTGLVAALALMSFTANIWTRIGLALQARAVGAFGRGLTIFSLIVAVFTVFAFEFFPVLAPLIWVLTISVVLIRRPALVRAA